MSGTTKSRGYMWGLGAESKVLVVLLTSLGVGVRAGEEVEAVFLWINFGSGWKDSSTNGGGIALGG